MVNNVNYHLQRPTNYVLNLTDSFGFFFFVGYTYATRDNFKSQTQIVSQSRRTNRNTAPRAGW